MLHSCVIVYFFLGMERTPTDNGKVTDAFTVPKRSCVVVVVVASTCREAIGTGEAAKIFSAAAVGTKSAPGVTTSGTLLGTACSIIGGLVGDKGTVACPTAGLNVKKFIGIDADEL